MGNDNGNWNLCCSGFEIYGKLRIKKSLYKNYKTSFDTNGILYNLGRSFGTNSNWKNPIDLKLISLESTKVLSDSQPNKYLIGRDVSRCITIQSKEPYFIVKFVDYLEVKPTHYSLRHYNSSDSECMRNWVFEAKTRENDEWEVLSEHVNDESIKGISGAFTWELKENDITYYNQFRVRMNG